MSANPKIVDLTKKFFPIIGEFLLGKEKEENKAEVSETEIHKYFQELHEQGEVEGLTFRYITRNGPPHSTQLYHVITNLIRKGRLNEPAGHLISLSSYGKNLMSEINRK